MAFEQGITHQFETSNIGKTKLSTALLVSKLFCSKNGRVSREADFVSKTAKILLIFVSRPTASKVSVPELIKNQLANIC